MAYNNDVQLFGWQNIDGSTYYFDTKTGYMATGNVRIGGITYKFGADGKHTEGTFVSYWWYTRYYFAGEMVKGFAVIGNDTYYFNESGNMVGGWQNIDGAYYYFGNDGRMATGTVNCSGVDYTFGEDGKLLSGTWVNYGSSKRYYVAGSYVTGWQEIDGNTYYFDVLGRVTTGTVLLGSYVYSFDNNGILLSTVEFSKYTGYVEILGVRVFVRNGRIVIRIFGFEF